MSILVDEAGNRWSLMECPHCEVYEMHAARPDGDGFQCQHCFATFVDQD